MDVQVKVEGLDNIVRKLGLLPDRVGNRALKRALRKGANVIRNIARDNARRIDDPQTAEVIAKNIAVQGMSRRREKEAGGVGVRVGVMGGARHKGGELSLPGGNTTHWRWVEFGTSKARAQPFMRPAIASGAMPAFDAFANAADGEIEKELRKLGP